MGKLIWKSLKLICLIGYILINISCIICAYQHWCNEDLGTQLLWYSLFMSVQSAINIIAFLFISPSFGIEWDEYINFNKK